ncbi:MAG: type II toxin-antitoxin system VapC family toxin [Oscillospiraceae bacterium]|nr:type II toxin-antitoxin system VapC family toxin [Oscillospiraceae bacterium]
MGTVGYLLDTCTLLWALRGSQNLSIAAKEAIADTSVTKYVSSVSAYEIMYKHQLKKLEEYIFVAENYFDVLEMFGAKELPLSARHAHLAGKFKWEHRDPFDRLLAAQASFENLTLITSDPAFDTLPWVLTVW